VVHISAGIGKLQGGKVVRHSAENLFGGETTSSFSHTGSPLKKGTNMGEGGCLVRKRTEKPASIKRSGGSGECWSGVLKNCGKRLVEKVRVILGRVWPARQQGQPLFTGRSQPRLEKQQQPLNRESPQGGKREVHCLGCLKGGTEAGGAKNSYQEGGKNDEFPRSAIRSELAPKNSGGVELSFRTTQKRRAKKCLG